jgi:hypothetical protein
MHTHTLVYRVARYDSARWSMPYSAALRRRVRVAACQLARARKARAVVLMSPDGRALDTVELLSEVEQ